MRESWKPCDSRTGETVGMASYPSEQMIRDAIAGWVERDKRGKRQDIHELIPHLVPKRVR